MLAPSCLPVAVSQDGTLTNMVKILLKKPDACKMELCGSSASESPSTLKGLQVVYSGHLGTHPFEEEECRMVFSAGLSPQNLHQQRPHLAYRDQNSFLDVEVPGA